MKDNRSTSTEAFQVKHTTRTKRIRQRPRPRKISRHQPQLLCWPEGRTPRPVFRNRQVRVREQQRGTVTPYGGVSLVHDLAMRLGIDRDLNRALSLLKMHMPYFESDHILTHAYNLYVGGTCIEDIASLQHSPALRSLLGACRIPDPTTAGDFLRRFTPESLAALQRVIDENRQKVWRRLPRQRRETATLDMDSTVKEVFGECKQGADFSYNGKWSYHPLLFTLAETHEPLRTINRPGNTASADGSGAALREVLPLLGRHFRQVRVRGDSKFYRRENIAACEEHDAEFAFVMDGYDVLRDRAEMLPNRAWQPFYEEPPAPAAGRKTPQTTRHKRRRWRQQIVRRRGYTTLHTTNEWVAEMPYTLPKQALAESYGLNGRTYRVIVKRQRVETSEGQKLLLVENRYRFVITNIPPGKMDAAEVLRLAHGRGDQENAIEQLKNGIAALRMPTGELRANGAFLLAGQLAWCLKTWLSLLALPKETVRWEWKWFRQAFVYVAAAITRTARRAEVRLAGAHRFVEHLVVAAQRLQSFAFP
jgi:hypothetical protein